MVEYVINLDGLGVLKKRAPKALVLKNANLDIFCLRDESLADSDNLPPREVIAQEIVDDLEAALEQFRLIAEDLRPTNGAAE